MQTLTVTATDEIIETLKAFIDNFANVKADIVSSDSVAEQADTGSHAIEEFDNLEPEVGYEDWAKDKVLQSLQELNDIGRQGVSKGQARALIHEQVFV